MQPIISMQKTILLFFLTITATAIFGQKQQEDIFNDGVGLLKKNSYEDAKKKFTEVIAKATDKELKKLSYVYRGFSYNGLADYKNAIADFDSAIKIDPTDLASYIDRGEAKGYQNEPDEGQKDFKYVLARDSTSRLGLAALYYLGLIAYNEKKANEAIGYYDRYLKLAPDNAEAYFNRGCAKGLLLQDISGSIKDYDKAIALNPDYRDAYANRGVAKINLFTTKGNTHPSKDQTMDACSDLKKAKALGDSSVDDMIFVYCDKK